MATAEQRFRAMGSDCHVLVVTPDLEGVDSASIASDIVALAARRVELLEQSWSRFRPTSELNHLNASAGAGPVRVSPDLLLLVDRMQQAWAQSEGRFDPTVLSSMLALGYDADFATVATRPASIAEVPSTPAPGMSAVRVDHADSTVSLPAGVGIDPGAIGKGLAADIIVEELMAAGAAGVLVNLGGDLAFAGTTADGSPWTIGVEDERVPADDPDRVLRALEFPAGTDAAAVATSTTLKRRWAQGRRHHVIDPRTGSTAVSDLVQVTVVADQAWNAEVTATTALLMRSDKALAWLGARGIPAILLTADRTLMALDEETHHG